MFNVTSFNVFFFILTLQGEDEVMCKLLQLLDSCQGLKHGLARAKRIRMVKAEIARLKKKGSVIKGMQTLYFIVYLEHYSEGLLITLQKLVRSPEIYLPQKFSTFTYQILLKKVDFPSTNVPEV